MDKLSIRQCEGTNWEREFVDCTLDAAHRNTWQYGFDHMPFYWQELCEDDNRFIHMMTVNNRAAVVTSSYFTDDKTVLVINDLVHHPGFDAKYRTWHLEKLYKMLLPNHPTLKIVRVVSNDVKFFMEKVDAFHNGYVAEDMKLFNRAQFNINRHILIVAEKELRKSVQNLHPDKQPTFGTNRYYDDVTPASQENIEELLAVSCAQQAFLPRNALLTADDAYGYYIKNAKILYDHFASPLCAFITRDKCQRIDSLSIGRMYQCSHGAKYIIDFYGHGSYGFSVDMIKAHLTKHLGELLDNWESEHIRMSIFLILPSFVTECMRDAVFDFIEDVLGLNTGRQYNEQACFDFQIDQEQISPTSQESLRKDSSKVLNQW